MEENHSKSTKNIGIAFLLNLLFSVIEFVGGIFTNSVSIISDSIHDFGDAISIAISWYLEKKSLKKPNSKYTYGYGRYSVLGALVTSIILLIGSVVMIYNAIPRLFNPEVVEYNGMIILGVLGVIINGAATLRTAKSERINEKVISLHLLEDVLGWIAVLIVSIVMKIFNIPILDPILSICITAFILYNVFENLKEIFEVFLEKSPDESKVNEIKQELLKNDKILDIHHVHSWSLDGQNNFFTMHVIIKNDMEQNDIIELKEFIRNEAIEHNIGHITIEIEYESEKCESVMCKISDNSEDMKHHHHH